MTTEILLAKVPALPASQGAWRAVYWEPVMQTGERVCVGFLTAWEQQFKAVLTIRPDLLATLFGAAGGRAHKLLERTFRLLNARLANVPDLQVTTASISGIYFGAVEASHVNSYADLLRVAKLMSSSLASFAEPDDLDAADMEEARPEQSQPARQFTTRIRDLAVTRNAALGACFNREASLMSTRRKTKFGFLSDSLVAQFGVLQPSNMSVAVRTTRGLIAELSLAQRASQRASLLVLGFPPLESPNLTDKERSIVQDYTEELSLEAKEFKVGFASADNDSAACDALMNAL